MFSNAYADVGWVGAGGSEKVQKCADVIQLLDSLIP